MFVIMQSLDNLKSDEKKTNNIPQNIGQTMTHAGVAITVTSITDIVVFAVGSSTVRINFKKKNFVKTISQALGLYGFNEELSKIIYRIRPFFKSTKGIFH